MVQEGSCLLELYLGVFHMSFHTVSAQSNVHQCFLKSVEEKKKNEKHNLPELIGLSTTGFKTFGNNFEKKGGLA